MSTSHTMAWKVKRYLADRRRVGFALQVEGEQLERFARFADAAGHRGPMTVKLAIAWASSSRHQKALTAARRIEVLQSFARYCQQFEPTTEIPARLLFGPPHRRLTPHIYTDDEIRELLGATADLYPPGGLRGACCATIFGLLAATGLRISEATGLKRSDVDLTESCLHVRHSKFGKSRWVMLHRTTAHALERYARQRDRDPLTRDTDSFFVFDYGRPALAGSVRYAFKLLRRRLRWRPRGGHPAPRIHDFRHFFICRRLEQWYAQGLDIERNILALSTYVGHAKVTDTYWYVTATPQLLAIAADRFERSRGGVT